MHLPTLLATSRSRTRRQWWTRSASGGNRTVGSAARGRRIGSSGPGGGVQAETFRAAARSRGSAAVLLVLVVGTVTGDVGAGQDGFAAGG